MLYPLYVHQDDGSAYGGSFPDFPGCFTAADDLADLPKAAQEAVEVHFDGEEADIPAPSDVTRWMDDPDYQGGFWLLVEIDLSKINDPSVRLNISMPSSLVRDIDRHVKSNHMTRSGFLAQAARDAMQAE
ncbi:MAG: type II toxin-antitoxin system HicB family antitoxin [Abyssibacter sp.]|uniref:type II toxin-antitoxin system HicB family antitoxin n=1 Tax=Abyssibacter sp. TaxID=2320200 RepID=UPI00321B3B90